MKRKKYKKNTELWDGIKTEIEAINGGKKFEYGKEFMKIKSDTNDNFPWNEQLIFPTATIVIRSVFEKNGKSCAQILLDECLYGL